MRVTKVRPVLVRGIVMTALALSLAGCGINNLPTFDEQVKPLGLRWRTSINGEPI